MMYDQILIRYGELALKGKNRKMFINQLHRNILNQLKNFPNVTLKSSREQMNLFLNGENPDKIIAACQQIFGIQNLSLAIKVENDLDTIKKDRKSTRLNSSH